MSKFRRLVEGAIGALGIMIGGEAAAEPPPRPIPGEVGSPPKGKLTREQLPVVMPSDFYKIPATERVALGRTLVVYFDDFFGGQGALAARWERTPPGEQEQMARHLFEAARLANVLVRQKLLGQATALNQEQAGQFRVHADRLAVALGQRFDERAFARFIDSLGQDRLMALYSQFRQTTEMTRAKPGGAAGYPPSPNDEAAAASAPPQEHKAGITKVDYASRSKKKPERPAPNRFVAGENPLERKYPGFFYTMGEVTEHEGRPTINLTFDDGVDLVFTPKILDILKTKGVKATFYILGSTLGPRTTPILQRMVAEGHEVALHSWDHPHAMGRSGLSGEAVWQKHVLAVSNKIKEQTGVEPKLFRAPEGSINESQLRALVGHGIRTVHWTIDTLDWQTPGAKQIKERVTKNAFGGAIVLMHSAGGRTREQTVAALPEVIADLEARGFVFVSSSEIIGATPIAQGTIKRSETRPAEGDKPAPTSDSPGSLPRPAPPDGGAGAQNIKVPDGGAPVEKKAERREVPKGAFALDPWGQPFGWNFENNKAYGDGKNPYKFFEVEPVFTDLGAPFVGKDKDTGEFIPVDDKWPIRLRGPAREAWQAMCQEFEQTVPKGTTLYKIGCFLTEGYRTFPRQEELIKTENKGGKNIAAEVGASGHHLGTTVDIYEGNRRPLYNWLYAKNPVVVKGKTMMVPRVVSYGFVPTVALEVWHLRFVGQELAVAYWQAKEGIIIKAHSKRIRDDINEEKN